MAASAYRLRSVPIAKSHMTALSVGDALFLSRSIGQSLLLCLFRYQLSFLQYMVSCFLKFITVQQFTTMNFTYNITILFILQDLFFINLMGKRNMFTK